MGQRAVTGALVARAVVAAGPLVARAVVAAGPLVARAVVGAEVGSALPSRTQAQTRQPFPSTNVTA